MADVKAAVETETFDVIAAIEAYGNAYNLGDHPFDIDAVQPFYRKNGPLTIAIPGAPDRVFLNWDEYAAGWGALLENFSSFFFSTNGDLAVSRLGPVAWASQTGESHGTRADGTEFRRALRQTLVMVLDDDGAWRIAQEHVSLGV